MTTRQERGASVDTCPSCRGIWLAPGALQKSGGALPAHAPSDFGPGERECPRCRQPLHVLDYGLLETDRCPKCRGVYLDQGELELLLRVAHPDAAPDQSAPSFWCDLCHRRHPLEEQVIGELLTVCGACAERQGIRRDLKARRRAELEKVQTGREASSSDAISTADTVFTVATLFDWILFFL
jgi:Zn-finger nucleic acid-binding protein